MMSKETQGFTESVLKDTWREFQKARKQVPYELWNESIFRWYFVRSALKLYPKTSYPNVEYHIEWNHFDLLAHFRDQDQKHLIEFKFFVRNRRYNLDGKPGLWKGGPGKNNFKEFCDCVRKLTEVEHQPSGDRFDERSLILVFPHHDEWTGRKSYCYRDWYRPLHDLDDSDLQDALTLRKPELPVQKCEIGGKVHDLYCLQFDLR